MLIVSQSTPQHLQSLLAQMTYDKLFVLSDAHTHALCLPRLSSVPALREAHHLVVPSGEEAKSMDTVIQLWRQLNDASATRHSVLLCLGGGMISDLGGFVASTFKRGMPTVYLSTTLLGAVDAATGGKTAVNFDGYKNLIGQFYHPEHVLIGIDLFSTLDVSQMLSGYAEMIKHALLSSEQDWHHIMSWDIDSCSLEGLTGLLERNIAIKQRIVTEDPTEQGLRKSLNFGHTIGHAIESWTHECQEPQPHGYAVLWGMVAELFLSHRKFAFPTCYLQQLIALMKTHYGMPTFTCKDYERLYHYMSHDKKNLDSFHVNFTLLEDVGIVLINQTAMKEEIFEALDFLREC